VGQSKTERPGSSKKRGEQPQKGTTGRSPLDEQSSGLFELPGHESGAGDIEEVVTRSRRGNGSNASAVSAFQRSADRFPPLEPEQQLALLARHREISARIVRMEQANRAREQDRLRELRREADRIVEHVAASCWKLAWLIVREQAEERFGRDRATDMLPDLLGEANYALVKAVKEFDPSMTPKFATYAARVIRDHTRAVLSRDGYVRLAPSWGRVKRLAATRLPEMTHELGRRPTIEELQADLTKKCLEWAENHLTEDQQRLPATQRKKLALAKLRKQGMLGAIRDIEEILVVSQSVVSLDAPLGDDGGSTLGETVAYEDQDDLLDRMELGELHERIMGFLDGHLTEREREIVLLRYGFDGSEGWTYSAIAERFDVSSERIRQIERGALEKLSAADGGLGGLRAYLKA
jgi:RNA polymerase sigma factor (sigma-70 family)